MTFLPNYQRPFDLLRLGQVFWTLDQADSIVSIQEGVIREATGFLNSCGLITEDLSTSSLSTHVEALRDVRAYLKSQPDKRQQLFGKLRLDGDLWNKTRFEEVRMIINDMGDIGAGTLNVRLAPFLSPSLLCLDVMSESVVLFFQLRALQSVGILKSGADLLFAEISTNRHASAQAKRLYEWALITSSPEEVIDPVALQNLSQLYQSQADTKQGILGYYSLYHSDSFSRQIQPWNEFLDCLLKQYQDMKRINDPKKLEDVFNTYEPSVSEMFQILWKIPELRVLVEIPDYQVTQLRHQTGVTYRLEESQDVSSMTRVRHISLDAELWFVDREKESAIRHSKKMIYQRFQLIRALFQETHPVRIFFERFHRFYEMRKNLQERLKNVSLDDNSSQGLSDTVSIEDEDLLPVMSPEEVLLQCVEKKMKEPIPPFRAIELSLKGILKYYPQSFYLRELYDQYRVKFQASQALG
ncbi:MAG: hypothetical protein IPJ69_02535 [Deltaproteobacteria bacterium]|nr:MAG: hypothetical protein IPJ69_02535 [Deltaproteobacteria bacterium]